MDVSDIMSKNRKVNKKSAPKSFIKWFIVVILCLVISFIVENQESAIKIGKIFLSFGVLFCVAYVFALIWQSFRRRHQQEEIILDGLSHIDTMNGHDFEYWCASLLKKNNFHDVQVTQGSNDQGVDILAYKDNERYAIQCKRYSKPLGNTPIQEVASGRNIYMCDKAVVMTNNFFTVGAIKAAEANNVELWDRDKIESLVWNLEDV